MKRYVMRSNFTEKLLQAAREHPSQAYNLQTYADDLDRAIERYVLDQRPHQLDAMLMEIAQARAIYAHVCERPLLAD